MIRISDGKWVKESDVLEVCVHSDGKVVTDGNIVEPRYLLDFCKAVNINYSEILAVIEKRIK